MVKMTQSFRYWIFNYHPEIAALIKFGHIELFTEELAKEYYEWGKSEEGKSYLSGGINFNESERIYKD